MTDCQWKGNAAWRWDLLVRSFLSSERKAKCRSLLRCCNAASSLQKPRRQIWQHVALLLVSSSLLEMPLPPCDCSRDTVRLWSLRKGPGAGIMQAPKPEAKSRD